MFVERPLQPAKQPGAAFALCSAAAAMSAAGIVHSLGPSTALAESFSHKLTSETLVKPLLKWHAEHKKNLLDDQVVDFF